MIRSLQPRTPPAGVAVLDQAGGTENAAGAAADTAATAAADAAAADAAATAQEESPAAVLELILAATNDGLMAWDIVTGSVRYSARWKSLFGYEAHELADTPTLWRELTHPDDLAEVESLLRDHTENVWPFAHTWRIRHKSGDWRWALCRAVTQQNSRGQPLRCLGVFTDVTDQVLAERRVSELKRRNDLLLASAGEGFLGIDQTGSVTFANPAALQLLGVARGTDLSGQSVGQLLRHGCAAEGACGISTCPILRPFLAGQPHKVTGASLVRRDGSTFIADYSSTPARDQDQVVGVVLTIRDVTEQRRLEAQHLQGQKLEALGQLAAGIAHEINTPMQYVGDNVHFMGTAFDDLLTLVREYRQLVEGLARGEPADEMLALVREAETTADIDYLIESIPKAIASTQEGIGRVRKIVYAMKEFSHPGRAEKSLEDVNHAVECTTVISANTWKHVASLALKLDPNLPKVSCHLGEINQVILNLIVNAAHAIADARGENAGSPSNVITIETATRNGFVEIRVADTGGGIPEAVRHRLFEPFFTTKEVGRGTGQGLTLARSMIVDRHGGFITFTTEVGKGTCFTVGLPLAEPG